MKFQQLFPSFFFLFTFSASTSILQVRNIHIPFHSRCIMINLENFDFNYRQLLLEFIVTRIFIFFYITNFAFRMFNESRRELKRGFAMFPYIFVRSLRIFVTSSNCKWDQIQFRVRTTFDLYVKRDWATEKHVPINSVFATTILTISLPLYAKRNYLFENATPTRNVATTENSARVNFIRR